MRILSKMQFDHVFPDTISRGKFIRFARHLNMSEYEDQQFQTSKSTLPSTETQNTAKAGLLSG